MTPADHYALLLLLIAAIVDAADTDDERYNALGAPRFDIFALRGLSMIRSESYSLPAACRGAARYFRRATLLGRDPD